MCRLPTCRGKTLITRYIAWLGRRWCNFVFTLIFAVGAVRIPDNTLSIPISTPFLKDIANYRGRLTWTELYLRGSRRRWSWRGRHLCRRPGICIRVFPEGGPRTYHRYVSSARRYRCDAQLLYQLYVTP